MKILVECCQFIYLWQMIPLSSFYFRLTSRFSFDQNFTYHWSRS